MVGISRDGSALSHAAEYARGGPRFTGGAKRFAGPPRSSWYRGDMPKRFAQPVRAGHSVSTTVPLSPASKPPYQPATSA
jgi:hypothetical protein